jgi:hypothetical protein
MSAPISKVCDELIEIRDQFEDNEELFEAITSSDNAEDLLVAIGMAVAYTEGNIATIDLVRDVSGACSRLVNKGRQPNTIVMSNNVFERVSRSTLLRDYLRCYSLYCW